MLGFRRRKQVVVITGASAGVGRATARLFAKQGAKIALLARGLDGLEATAREVIDLGGEPLPLPTDMANHIAVEAAAHAIEETLGPIDVWINNAMVSVFSPVKRMKAEEYRRVTEVTYLGAVNGTLAALRRMLRRNRGVIVQVGSALAYRAIPLQSAYCAAKHALRGFTESLRTELMHDKSNVKVTIVHLPALNTPQFDWVKSRMRYKAQPVPPIFQPEIAADAIVWASRHPRREVLVGYPTVKTVMGNKIAPWYADRVAARRGYVQQQTNEPENRHRQHNLWEPVEGDYGAHGRFDERAKPFSMQHWLNKYRLSLAGSAAIGGAALAIGASIRRHRQRQLREQSREMERLIRRQDVADRSRRIVVIAPSTGVEPISTFTE